MVQKDKISKKTKPNTKVRNLLKISDSSILDISEANSLRDKLIHSIEGADEITIDATGVERITSPCIQVLLAAAHHLHKRRGHFHLLPSQPIRETMCLLGLEKTLSEWSERV